MYIEIKCGLEFQKRIGAIRDHLDLLELSLKSDTINGRFNKDRVHELLEFCKNNPEYHVVSILDGPTFVNGYTTSGYQYLLADGEKDVRLIYRVWGRFDLEGNPICP